MKKLLAIALLASAFTLTSCGGGSIVDKVAKCTCETLEVSLKAKKEMEAAPEDKKDELAKKFAELMKKPACMTALEAETDKIKNDTTAAGKAKAEAMGKDLEAAVEKKCGSVIKELKGQ